MDVEDVQSDQREIAITLKYGALDTLGDRAIFSVAAITLDSKAITNVANCADNRFKLWTLLGAQATDMYINCASTTEVVIAPDFLQ